VVGVKTYSEVILDIGIRNFLLKEIVLVQEEYLGGVEIGMSGAIEMNSRSMSV